MRNRRWRVEIYTGTGDAAIATHEVWAESERLAKEEVLVLERERHPELTMKSIRSVIPIDPEKH